MADKVSITFTLNNKELPPPKNWQDITLSATFGDDIQPVIEVDDFVFVNESAKEIMDWVAAGKIFEGIPFTLQFAITLPTPEIIIYNGALDCTEMEVISPVEVRIKMKPDEGLDLLDKKIQGLSYGYLADLDGGERGHIDAEHYTDVPVIIRKKFDGVETAMTAFIVYLMTKEVLEFTKEQKAKIIQATKTLLTTPLNKPAEIFTQIAMLLVYLAYYAFMLIALLNLVNTLFTNLFPRPTKYKGITLRTALERALDRFHLELDCDIPELDYFVYLPSKTDNKIRKNRKDEGIPNTDDFGYQVSEMFSLVFMLFRAKSIRITDGNGKRKLIIVAEKSDRLRQLSTYELPNGINEPGRGILTERYRYNTDEMRANFLLTFQYDPSDEYTMPNARDTPFDSKKADEEKNRYEKGTSYEVITDIKDADAPYKLAKGFEEIRIPLALGTRRNTLSVLERSAQLMFGAVDAIIKLFGGKTIGEKIDDGRGRLIISHNSFSIPKLICLQNGLIPKNHRDILSARALYQNYHYWRSFKTNPDNSQGKVYENIRIPFGFTDFVKTQRTSVFTTQGSQGRFKTLSWRFSSDTATCSYIVYQRYVNPDALTEKFIEP